tara:strand:+ start:3497 stop:3769 length:273 start_codon:yes stop_codon:yes gene_type:complete
MAKQQTLDLDEPTRVDKILAKVKPMYHKAKAKAQPYAKSAFEYAKENPGDVMIGLITLMVWDIEDSVDEIEEASNVSAYVDASNYMDGGR